MIPGEGTFARRKESPKQDNALANQGLEEPFRMKYLLAHFEIRSNSSYSKIFILSVILPFSLVCSNSLDKLLVVKILSKSFLDR